MVTTTREPGEPVPYEGTKEQKQRDERRELEQSERAREETKDYFKKVW